MDTDPSLTVLQRLHVYLGRYYYGSPRVVPCIWAYQRVFAFLVRFLLYPRHKYFVILLYTSKNKENESE